VRRRVFALFAFAAWVITAPPQVGAAATQVYWSDSNASTLWRANADGSGASVIVPLTAGAEPRGIAVAAEAGFLYWAENGTNRIRRAGLDGASPEDIITSGLGFPADIEIDPSTAKLYWADRDLDVIRRANLDGTGVETVVSVPAPGNNAAPYFLEIDPAAGKLYWSDFDSGVIHRANLDGSSPQDFVTGLDRVRDIEILDDMIYWTDRDARLVQRQRLDGSQRETLHGPTGLVLPHGLALDASSGLLFIADADGAQVVRGSLDGTGAVAPIAAAGLQNPWDVDLLLDATASADFDDDGAVDGDDFLIWQRGLSTDDASRIHGDANGDEAVDALDLDVWRTQFGQIAGAQTIPEPPAGMLYTLGTVVLLRLRLASASRSRAHVG
jgi:sugar lactone lactonase YvrE